MNHSLVTRLALDTAGTDSEVTQPVSMEGSNAVSWDATGFAHTATTVAFQLQLSNDLENWSNQGTAQSTGALGHKLFTSEASITAAYVRLQISITAGTGKTIVAAGMTLSAQ